MTHTRRNFLLGFAGVLAAPAIVRAASLMPVSPFDVGAEVQVWGSPPIDLRPGALNWGLRVDDIVLVADEFGGLYRVSRTDY